MGAARDGPAPVADPAHDERISALPAALASACASRRTPFVGLAPLLADDGAWLDEVASVDGAHLRRTGYPRMASLLEPESLDWLSGLARST